jgi:hypothetical protein
MTILRTTIKFDADALTAALARASSLAEAGKLPAEVAKRTIEAVEAGAQLAAFRLDGGAAAVANELTLFAEPGQALLDFLAAAGAGDVDDGVVEKALGHSFTPTVGFFAVPTVAESPAGQKPAGGEGKTNSGDGQ